MFDMVKGLFIVVMMLGHTLTDYYPPWVIRNDGTWIGLAYDMLDRLLCCGMIPMFCIICGYGFRQKPMGKCLRGQIRFLWKPYVWMTLAITAGIAAEKLLLHGSIGEGLRYQVLPYLLGTCPQGRYFGMELGSVGPVWFLIVYVLAGVLLNALLHEQHLWGQVLLAAVLAAAGVALKDIRIPFCFQQSLICTLYMYIGWLMKKKKLLQTSIPLRWWVIGGAAVLFSVCFGEIEVSQNVWGGGLTDVLAGVFGGVMLLMVLLPLNERRGRAASALRWAGRRIMPMPWARG